MTQVPCVYLQTGDSIDHTPASAVTAGDVVLKGDQLVTIAKCDIPADKLGAVSTSGAYTVPKDSSDITDGDALYWDADGNPVGGDAGSGAFSSNSALGPFAGWALANAGSSAETVPLLLRSKSSAETILRSDLGQDDLAVFGLELDSWRVTGTGALLGATAGTPSGAFALTYGTFGTASPKIVGEAANNNSKTNKMRRQFTLPAEYVAGQTITLRTHARITGDVEVAQTIDAVVYKADREAGLVGSPTDLCATAAQALTSSFANQAFTITPTGLVPGDILDLELTGLANDTGGTANKLIEIGAVDLLLDIKG